MTVCQYCVRTGAGCRLAGSCCGGRALAGPVLTGKEEHQCARVDDRFGQEPGVIPVGSPGHQVEIHGDESRLCRGTGGGEELLIA